LHLSVGARAIVEADEVVMAGRQRFGAALNPSLADTILNEEKSGARGIDPGG
jgi:hypothetical protein